MPGCHVSDLPAVRECKGDVLTTLALDLDFLDEQLRLPNLTLYQKRHEGLIIPHKKRAKRLVAQLTNLGFDAKLTPLAQAA